jgi:hypothetical protein
MLLAWITFVSPWMLGGLALVALPVIAHLLSRRTRRRIVFPTIRLLKASRSSTPWLYRMRRWVLLVLRCLVVCAIVAAFARPEWLSRDVPDAAGSRGAAVVLVVDTSASASQRAGGVSLAGSLQALAERTLGALDPGTDRAGIVYATAQPTAALPELTHDLTALRKELAALRPTHDRADLPRAIALAGELLKTHRGQRRLVVLSDMQRTNWADVTLRKAAGVALPTGTVVTVLPAGGGAAQNVSLSGARTLPVQPLAGQPVRLVVRAANYSPAKRVVRVAAVLDGRPAGSKQVDLPAWEARDVVFDTRLDQPGRHRVVFTTSSGGEDAARDDLLADNAAYLTVSVVRRVPVVVVGDDNPGEPGTSTYFTIRALAPRGDMGDDLEVRHLTSADVTYPRLAGAEAVFVTYVGRLSDQALSALHMYANQGGGVAFCCGQGPVAENLLALKGAAGQADILAWTPSALRELDLEGAFLQFGKGAWDSAPLAEFDPASRAALQQIRMGKVWAVSRLTPKAHDVLRYTDGTPAISSRTVGAGKLVLCNFSPALSCGDLGKYGGFVALTHGLFHYLRPQSSLHARAVAGEPLSVPVALPPAARGQGLRARGPDQKPLPVQVTAEHGESRVMANLGRPRLPGFYEIFPARGGGPAVSTLAVNVDPRESDLRRIDSEVLRENLTADGLVLDLRERTGSGPILQVRGEPLWPYFVLMALVAVGLELLLLGLWKQ